VHCDSIVGNCGQQKVLFDPGRRMLFGRCRCCRRSRRCCSRCHCRQHQHSQYQSTPKQMQAMASQLEQVDYGSRTWYL
jgi:hypothetical protein